MGAAVWIAIYFLHTITGLQIFVESNGMSHRHRALAEVHKHAIVLFVSDALVTPDTECQP